MMWAKTEKKHIFPRPRMAMMTIYTIGLCVMSLAAFAGVPPVGDYRITLQEAEQRIAEELMRNGAGDDIQASIIGRRSEDMVRRSVPVVMEIADFEADKDKQSFTATLSFATEAALDRPSQKLGNLMVAGRYDRMVDVPVLKYRLTSGDIIREQDIDWQKLPSSRIDRDTVLESAMLVGKSPARGLSPNRAIEKDEIVRPSIVMRRQPVKMSYQSRNITINAIGTAMEDGAMGDRIKVRNDDSGLEVDARVVDRGRVEVTPTVYINTAANG